MKKPPVVNYANLHHSRSVSDASTQRMSHASVLMRVVIESLDRCADRDATPKLLSPRLYAIHATAMLDTAAHLPEASQCEPIVPLPVPDSGSTASQFLERPRLKAIAIARLRSLSALPFRLKHG